MLLFHSAMDLGRLRWAISRKEPMLIRLILHTNSQGRLDRSLSGEGRPQPLLLSGDHEHRRSHWIWLCWEEGLAEGESSFWCPNIFSISLFFSSSFFPSLCGEPASFFSALFFQFTYSSRDSSRASTKSFLELEFLPLSILYQVLAKRQTFGLPIFTPIQESKITHRDPAIPNAYSAPFPSSLYKAGAARWPLLVPMIKWGLFLDALASLKTMLDIN